MYLCLMERTLQLKGERLSFLSSQQSAFTFYPRSDFWTDLSLWSRLLSFCDKLQQSTVRIRCIYSFFREDIFPGSQDCPSALLRGVRNKDNELWEGLWSSHKVTVLGSQAVQAVCEGRYATRMVSLQGGTAPSLCIAAVSTGSCCQVVQHAPSQKENMLKSRSTSWAPLASRIILVL